MEVNNNYMFYYLKFNLGMKTEAQMFHKVEIQSDCYLNIQNGFTLFLEGQRCLLLTTYHLRIF